MIITVNMSFDEQKDIGFDSLFDRAFASLKRYSIKLYRKFGVKEKRIKAFFFRDGVFHGVFEFSSLSDREKELIKQFKDKDGIFSISVAQIE